MELRSKNSTSEHNLAGAHGSKTYLRHRAQSYVEGAVPAGEEYETVIPAEDEGEFVDKETVEVAEEVIEVSNITRGLLAETVLGKVCCLGIGRGTIQVMFEVISCSLITGLDNLSSCQFKFDS